MFEGGNSELIAAALNDVARAKGITNDPALTSDSDIVGVIHTLKAFGLKRRPRRPERRGLTCLIRIVPPEFLSPQNFSPNPSFTMYHDMVLIARVDPCAPNGQGVAMPTESFAEAKRKFDAAHSGKETAQCIVPVNGKTRADISIRDSKGEPSEEYYKWQFINGLINSGLYAHDFIGVEVQFPKGNSAPLRLDAAIFDNADWIDHYNAYWRDRKVADLEWLNDHLLAVVEFKKNDKNVEKVFTSQVKPAMREREPANAYVLGVYYGADRLYLFQRREGKYLRYDEGKNAKGDDSRVGDLQLHLPDAYAFIPSFEDLKKRVNRTSSLDRSDRAISDLDIVTTIASVQIQSALSDVLRSLDKANLVDQRGYGIFLQTFALKVFDEKRNERHSHRKLDFYVTPEEAGFGSLTEGPIQGFVTRMIALRDEAAGEYQKILAGHMIDWQDPRPC